MQPAASSRWLFARARLIEAARDELIERDGALEVDSVATRAGASIGLIYRHFDNRAGLVGAVVEDLYGRFHAEVLAGVATATGSSARGVRGHTEATARFHYTNPLARILLTNRHLESEVALAHTAHLDAMMGLTADAIRTGGVPHGRDPVLIAAMLVGGTRSVLAQCLMAGLPQETAAEHLWHFTVSVLGIDPSAADA